MRMTAFVFAAMLGGADGIAAQDSLEQWKAGLVELTRDGGTWRTSNSMYVAEDGGIEAYGMRYRLELGDVSATGCLWGERAGEVTAVYWHFFQGWDPVDGRPLVYQSGPNGAVGVGRETAPDEKEQTFMAPGTAATRVRHLSSTRGDTLVTRSFDGTDEGWTARRTYAWIRSSPDRAPC